MSSLLTSHLKVHLVRWYSRGFVVVRSRKLPVLKVILGEMWPVHGVGARFNAHLKIYSGFTTTTARPKALQRWNML